MGDLHQTTVLPAYEKLCNHFRRVGYLRSSSAVLNWDQETYLPPAGVAYRADQIAHLEGQAHEQSTQPIVDEWLSLCEAQLPQLPLNAQTNVRGWRRRYDLAVKLPSAFVEDWARTTSQAQSEWATARKKSDFSLFQPWLEKLVQLAQQKADYWGWTTCRYDALIDEYEPGAKTADLSEIFATLAPQISDLLGPARERSARVPADLLDHHYPISAQQQFNREVAEAMGFDFTAGRIDTTTHPFCTHLGPRDVRLTTRYDERDFTSSLYGVMHEAGHGLYEQGFDATEWGRPAGEAASLGIHESQSRLWENHVGGQISFWEHWLPRAAHFFPELRSLDPETMALAVARVQPSFIRVEADEVSYDLHVILRFEIEKQLIEGTLAVREVPAFWNERFEQLLGLKVPDAARGCLQDVHWSCGLFGYFATYTLGNLNAAQLMHQHRQENPALDSQLRSGQYADLLAWLRQKIHRPGQRWQPLDLMREVTQEPTHPRYHHDYLRSKYVLAS